MSNIHPDKETSAATGRLSAIQIDCHNPEELASFWGRLLGFAVRKRVGQYVCLERPDSSAVGICFQEVPESKRTKNRLHLDVAVEDIESAATRVGELGGSQVSPQDIEEHGWRFRVMADPEGNEFCLTG